VTEVLAMGTSQWPDYNSETTLSLSGTVTFPRPGVRVRRREGRTTSVSEPLVDLARVAIHFHGQTSPHYGFIDSPHSFSPEVLFRTVKPDSFVRWQARFYVARKNLNRVSDLGWSKRTAREVRSRLTSFEDDWNAPGMSAYDKY